MKSLGAGTLAALIGLAMLSVPGAFAQCVVTSAPVGDLSIDQPDSLNGFDYAEERQNCVASSTPDESRGVGCGYDMAPATSPPPYGWGARFGEGTWTYEETNGIAGLQAGGSSFVLLQETPGCGTVPCLFFSADDPVEDGHCGAGPDRLVHGMFLVDPFVPQCRDQVDNDGDGLIDWPLDPGCIDPNDATEDPNPPAGPCPPIALAVAACLEPGDVVLTQPVALVNVVPDGTFHRVVGYVEAYRFVVAGIGVTLPCVVLGVDATTANPCALAGGTFVERTLVLVDQTFEGVKVEPGPVLATVKVCEATLTVKVGAFGVDNVPALALC